VKNIITCAISFRVLGLTHNMHYDLNTVMAVFTCNN